MALSGHLSDLSLSELIEFFCNQRKTGRLTVLYPGAPGHFCLQAGSVVDARIGVLRGIDAVYYALTLPNAKFEFSGACDSTERTINQPWTQVVLEGLRRLDEGIAPADAFPAGYEPENNEKETAPQQPTVIPDLHESRMPAFLSLMEMSTMGRRKPMIITAIAIAVLGSVAVVGVPAGWYSKTKSVPVVTKQPDIPAPTNPEPVVASSPATPASAEVTAPGTEAAVLAAKRQREREKARLREERAASDRSLTPSPTPAAANGGPKRIAVTVNYDESGRVTQASGSDANALRIARQKRFPPGRAGSATITIPIN